MQQYILAFDAGTTSSRAILFDQDARIVARAQREFRQYFPQPGWVEHDPEEIWKSQWTAAKECIKKAGIKPEQIAGLGITNQRETTIVWNKSTGKTIGKAIVWQDRRTAGLCDTLKEEGWENAIREKTGLLLDAYFSATKLKWILDQDEEVRKQAERGELAFGTVDSWLVWKLTGGKRHVTDVTNAARTLLYNIHELQWDQQLLNLFSVPEGMLPEVKPSAEIFGMTDKRWLGAEIPVAGILGDQQAALLGQMCFNPGMVKNTYGTGCFVVMNTGHQPIASANNLLTTVAWHIGDNISYALEGSIFTTGAVVQWLRDQMKIIKKSEEIEVLAAQVPDNGGVYFVPAFVGLGTPHWDQYARGAILGLTRGTSAAHLARAALESIAYQTYDVVKAMEEDCHHKILEMRVDGGSSVNNLLMQFQADILETNVLRPRITETTSRGAAFAAGLAVDLWKDFSELESKWEEERSFSPKMEFPEVSLLVNKWRKAVKRSLDWEE